LALTVIRSLALRSARVSRTLFRAGLILQRHSFI